MPLKIESGTYTVNRRSASAPAKKHSKFTLWRHWRRSVHEERGSSEELRQQQLVVGPAAKQQVARLPPASSGHAESETSPVPRSSGARRSRPHSLAVQPLHYQRLDPEQPLEPASRARKPRATDAGHPNMTSQESIGSCSLDVERSASDRSDVNAEVSLSEKTLHSLNLSNGEECEQQQQQQPEIRVTSEEAGDTPVSNGHQSRRSECEEQLTPTPQKKPSYLGLACSINGYSGITRYDSKLREGFRSRDSSPGARLITRDTSPAGFRSCESPNTSLQSQPPKSQSISPLAMERHHNGFTNGVREKSYKIESYIESGKSMSFNQGYSEVDRGVTTNALHSNNFSGQLSPIRASSPNKRGSPVGTRVTTYNQQNKSYSSTVSNSSPKSYNISVSHTSYHETSVLNGSSGGENETLNASANSEKSFIQQRVERLYGPGALAQGFFFKRSHHSNKLNTSDTSNESTNNNNTSLDEENVEESLKNLPVLRHLRPEFRAQLPVVSPRKPTDGTEQLIKPLKRISISPGKNDTKEAKASPVKKENNATNDSKMTASTTSLTDQQPAAPKVVLPVLEPSSSSTNIPKQGKEEFQEKNGHYFIALLSKERDRLIVLAEQAEAELENNKNLPEEAAGKLRSGAGKARLLATQKMKQFEGLCHKNLNQVPGDKFPTTSDDLAGFWDMVMLQVVQVNDLFALLDRLRESQWQEIVPELKSTSATPQNGSAMKRRQTPASKTKSAANTEAARKAREAREAREQTRRQLLEERRRAMRSHANKTDNSVEIFIPET